MVSLAHGTNDAQKTMGVITLALIVNGTLPSGSTAPFWVILSCALAISIGTYLGGWRVIRTLGKGLVEIESPQGMAAESASAAVILLSSSFGYSLSTTHVATGSIIGTGLRQEGRRCPLEHRRSDGHRLGVHLAGRRADGCWRRRPGPRGRPHAGVILDLATLAAWRPWSTGSPARSKVDHNNVNEEWNGSVAPAEPEPAAAA